MPEIQASFLYLFSYAPLGDSQKGDAFLENFFVSFWGFVCRQPPKRQPLFETSDYYMGRRSEIGMQLMGGDADGGERLLCGFCVTVRRRLPSAECHRTAMQMVRAALVPP